MIPNYPLPGTRVRCIHMDDPNPVPPGTEGTVMVVDDAKTIHVKWDNGSTLGLTELDQWELCDVSNQ